MDKNGPANLLTQKRTHWIVSTDRYSAIYMHHQHQYHIPHSTQNINWSLSLADNEARCLEWKKKQTVGIHHIERERKREKQKLVCLIQSIKVFFFRLWASFAFHLFPVLTKRCSCGTVLSRSLWTFQQHRQCSRSAFQPMARARLETFFHALKLDKTFIFYFIVNQPSHSIHSRCSFDHLILLLQTACQLKE